MYQKILLRNHVELYHSFAKWINLRKARIPQFAVPASKSSKFGKLLAAPSFSVSKLSGLALVKLKRKASTSTSSKKPSKAKQEDASPTKSKPKAAVPVPKSAQIPPQPKTKAPASTSAHKSDQEGRKPLIERKNHIKALKETEYDVLTIGGGATGVGCALDAATRGLKTALVEADDFASGTSSKSTKLIHGGVRYLQDALMKFDREQFAMVREGLRERATLLKIAPHLNQTFGIMLPIYTYWQIPYFWIGMKMYDLVAGSSYLKHCHFATRSAVLSEFPMLKSKGLTGAVVYYDGLHDDARMCVSVALTAVRFGANICNHMEVVKLLKDDKKRLSGAVVKDSLTGDQFTIRAKCIINATGPFTDFIRQMDDPKQVAICAPSAGTHIVLPQHFCSKQYGLLDPATSDGRVIFFVPWHNRTIVGTTDIPCPITYSPRPTEAEIEFILKDVAHYIDPAIKLRRSDVQSAWSGIRPLVNDPTKGNTKSLVRNHIVNVSPSRLITIAGGKWTTYRAMAEETVNEAIKRCDLRPLTQKCVTADTLIEGAHGWSPNVHIQLMQKFQLDEDIAYHLSTAYGMRAYDVAKHCTRKDGGSRDRLHREFPYVKAEVRHCIKEYACTAVDMIARRLRLCFLNSKAASEVLPKIIKIMGKELHWSDEEREHQAHAAEQFLKKQMALDGGSETTADASDIIEPLEGVPCPPQPGQEPKSLWDIMSTFSISEIFKYVQGLSLSDASTTKAQPKLQLRENSNPRRKRKKTKPKAQNLKNVVESIESCALKPITCKGVGEFKLKEKHSKNTEKGHKRKNKSKKHKGKDHKAKNEKIMQKGKENKDKLMAIPKSVTKKPKTVTKQVHINKKLKQPKKMAITSKKLDQMKMDSGSKTDKKNNERKPESPNKFPVKENPGFTGSPNEKKSGSGGKRKNKKPCRICTKKK